MTEERVSVSVEEGVADVRLARPEKMNALDPAMFAAIAELSISEVRACGSSPAAQARRA